MAVFKHLKRLTYGQVRKFSLNFSPEIQKFIDQCTDLLSPKDIHICDGTIDEREMLFDQLLAKGTLVKLDVYHNCFVARSDPRDTGRVESKTYTAAYSLGEWLSAPAPGVTSKLGNYIRLCDAEEEISNKFKNSMRGRKMYVLPFLLGPPKSSKQIVGIQMTDSALTAIIMGITTRMGKEAMEVICSNPQVRLAKGVHSMGKEEGTSGSEEPPWPCDPDRFFLVHIPDREEVWSYGSNWPSNSVLTRESIALKIASARGKSEAWMAERMAVMGIQRSKTASKKYFIGVMGPPGVGKSTLVSMIPCSEEYNISLISDDISWLRTSSQTMHINAMNPERGTFSLVNGMNWTHSPGQMTAAAANTIFFNIATTSTGATVWHGMDALPTNVEITDWKCNPWNETTWPSHPNARFTNRLGQFASLDECWDKSDGVPLSAIIVASKRSSGAPLIYEMTNFRRGVFNLATLHSETYPTSEVPEGLLKPEPFGSGIYLGDSLGKYITRWLLYENAQNITLPRMFGLNLFSKDLSDRYLWPGYGENIRILDWVVRRLENCARGLETPIGTVPVKEDFDRCNLWNDLDQLFAYRKHFWENELNSAEEFFKTQVPYDTPEEMVAEIQSFRSAICCYEECCTKSKAQK